MFLFDILRFLFWTCPILIWDGIRLSAFVLVLSPGFCRFLWYYVAVARRVTVKYADDSCRQSLDVYCPDETSYQMALEYCRARRRARHGGTPPLGQGEPIGNLVGEAREESISSLIRAPTVIFLSGGAWLIGYKLWGCLLARALTAQGVLVVLPDYRNYPWGNVPNMVDDVDHAIDWTLQNIERLGGDPEQVVLVGQSAGGHLGLMSLWRRACRQGELNLSVQQDTSSDAEQGASTTSSWNPKDLSGFLALSAPFNLPNMEHTFRKHGLDGKLVNRIFGGKQEAYDPWSLLQQLPCEKAESVTNLLPPIRLYHGSCDKTVPCHGSQNFAEALRQARPDIEWKVYDGWSHTDAILEGPMQGDHRFHDDIIQATVDWTNFELANEDEASRIRRQQTLCPRILVRCAKCLNPF